MTDTIYLVINRPNRKVNKLYDIHFILKINKNKVENDDESGIAYVWLYISEIVTYPGKYWKENCLTEIVLTET